MIPKSAESVMPVAFYAGSFNPFTKGHLSIVERAVSIFGKVIIGVGINSSKGSTDIDNENILASVRNSVSHLPQVSVISYSTLTVRAAKEVGATVLIRGVRDTRDYEYEKGMAEINRRISGLETVLMFSLPEYEAISSSIVRELERFGEDVKPYLP